MLGSILRKKKAYVYNDLKTIFLCSSKCEALLWINKLADKYEKDYQALFENATRGYQRKPVLNGLSDRALSKN